MVLRQCNVCGRRFTKTEHFKRHERSHTREKPYKCSVCEKAFSRSDVLFRHMKCHAPKPESDAQTSPPVERRHTISDGVTDQQTAQQQQQQQSHRRSLEQTSGLSNQAPPGISVMQLLSPNNDYDGHQESGNNANSNYNNDVDADHSARTGSLGMPSSYTDPRQNQHRHDHIAIPTNWGSSQSPVNPTVQQANPSNPHRHSPSQRSADVSTYDTSMPDSNQPAQTPQSDLAATNFGAHPIGWLPSNGMSGTDFQDPFQMWLFPSLDDLEASPDFLQTYGTGPAPGFTMPDLKAVHDGHTSQERTKNISKVPRERFSRVQRCWSSRPHRLHRMMPSLWQDVIAYHFDNLFSDEHGVPSHPKAGANWGVDADCRFRLRDAFRTPAPSVHHSPRIQSTTPLEPVMKQEDSSIFPPAEILDIAMGLFFRRFHPTVPFIHVPTFSVKGTPPPLLFVVCLIGLSILGTTGATRFVSRMFPSFLQRVSNDLALCTSGSASPTQQLTYIAAALLTLHLAAMTGDKDTITQSQMLYVTTMAIAQQNGLFSACDGQDLSVLILDLNESEHQWKAWSRVESVKRLILCTITLDSWYSTLLSRSPIVRSESVRLYAPCDEQLFQAKSATQFQSLIRSGRSPVSSTVQISDIHTGALDPSVSLGFLGSSTLLALLQIQIFESYHRLMPADPEQIGSLIPWQLYAADMKARSLVPAVLTCTSVCGPQMRIHDTNTLVLWHSLNILLLADFRMFELAAGRHGAGPATGALESISSWSQTASARRAVVHAAQNFKLMHDRRVSDNVTVHSVGALFASALVLGLYLFMVPPASNHANRTIVELVDYEIDWMELADMGYTDDNGGATTIEYSSAGGQLHDQHHHHHHHQHQHGRSGSRGGSNTNTTATATNNNNYAPLPGSNPHSSTAVHHPDSDLSAPSHFVKYGGTVSLSGVTHQGGYESARRVLLDFANLMDGISGRKLRVYTQVLHIMSDDLMVYEAKE